MSTIQDLYEEASVIALDIEYDDYIKNTEALILVLSMTNSKGVGDVTCTDPFFRDEGKNIFFPSSVSQGGSGDVILCKDVLYSFRNTIREFNKFIYIIGKRRNVSSSSSPNSTVQTLQINSVNIQAEELNCCVSATVDRERYGDCTDNIRQTSDISVKITDVDIDEFEKAFMIQKINNALYEDFEGAVSRSTCKTEAEKQDIIGNIDIDVNVTQEIEQQFIRMTQINRQNYYIKDLWAWGPCFDLNQSNNIDIDVNLNKEIVGTITRDVYAQFISRNPNFVEIMNTDNEYLTTECSPDCTQDIQNPRCTGGGDVCEGKVDGDTCPGGGVCDGGVCRERGVCEGKVDGTVCDGDGVCDGGVCGDGGGGDTSKGDTSNGGLSTAVIVVIVVVGVLLFIGLAVLLYLVYTRQSKDKREIGESGLGIYF